MRDHVNGFVGSVPLRQVLEQADFPATPDSMDGVSPAEVWVCYDRSEQTCRLFYSQLDYGAFVCRAGLVEDHQERIGLDYKGVRCQINVGTCYKPAC